MVIMEIIQLVEMMETIPVAMEIQPEETEAPPLKKLKKPLNRHQ
jgi:hypothetical protein